MWLCMGLHQANLLSFSYSLPFPFLELSLPPRAGLLLIQTIWQSRHQPHPCFCAHVLMQRQQLALLSLVFWFWKCRGGERQIVSWPKGTQYSTLCLPPLSRQPPLILLLLPPPHLHMSSSWMQQIDKMTMLMEIFYRHSKPWKKREMHSCAGVEGGEHHLRNSEMKQFIQQWRFDAEGKAALLVFES